MGSSFDMFKVHLLFPFDPKEYNNDTKFECELDSYNPRRHLPDHLPPPQLHPPPILPPLPPTLRKLSPYKRHISADLTHPRTNRR